VTILEIRNTSDVKTLVKRIRSRQIGAYIVAAPATEYPGLSKTLKDNAIIFSTISANNPASSELKVVADERTATYKMVRSMIELGHQRFAFVGGSNKQRATKERQKGFTDAIQECTTQKIQYEIYQCGVFFEDGYRQGLEVLRQKNRPTAIQCLTDDIAAGVIAAAQELGIDLPNELSICGFDNFGLARKISPALTTAHLPAEEMAEMATRQVIRALERKEQDAEVVLACDVIIRSSVAQPIPKLN
jgi:LacI family transcriptional regulator